MKLEYMVKCIKLLCHICVSVLFWGQINSNSKQFVAKTRLRFTILYKVHRRDVCDVKSRGWRKLMKRDMRVTQQSQLSYVLCWRKHGSKKQQDRSSCWLLLILFIFALNICICYLFVAFVYEAFSGLKTKRSSWFVSRPQKIAVNVSFLLRYR